MKASLRLCLSSLLVTNLLLALSGCGADVRIPATATTPPVTITHPSIWVGAWGNSPTNAVATASDNPGGSNQSFRFLVYPTLSGTQERVRFSNYFGTTPITISAARLSIGSQTSPAIDATHDQPLAFSGSPTVTIPPGQIVVSDPVSVTFTYGQRLAVSVYLAATFPPLTRHDAIVTQSWRTPAGTGNTLTDTAGTTFTQPEGDWLLLNGIDVYGAYQGTIVMIGSSTTDGFKSNYGDTAVYPAANTPVPGQDTDRLPDQLAKRLNAAGYQLGVINAGINGDTLTAAAATPNVQDAIGRFNRDVLAVPNVVTLITYLGAIDLRSSHCTSAPDLETGTQTLVAMAAAAKVQVLLGTLPPSAFCTNPASPNFGPSPTPSDPYAGGQSGSVNGAEVQRLAFNAWLRSTGPTLPGVVGLADYDKALADPARPDFLLAPYNSGDNFHPNGNGYGAAAAAVPLNLLIPAK